MSTSFGWGKGKNVTPAGWQVTLYDPMWHVSSRSCVANCYTLVTYLLTYLIHNWSYDNAQFFIMRYAGR